MKTISPPSPSHLVSSPRFMDSGGDGISEIATKISHDFSRKVGLHDDEAQRIADIDGDGDGDDENEEEEFSFDLTCPDFSPISADDIFLDGLIRPAFPVFSTGGYAEFDSASPRPPLRKLFYENRDPPPPSSSKSGNVADGPYCDWSSRREASAAVVETSPQVCKKSNSTGFSRLWRFRNMARRSSSDGKDAFVFLNPNSRAAATGNMKIHNNDKIVVSERKRVGVGEGKARAKGKGVKGKTASSVYARNREARERLKRRSYLPYRLGFFTNVEGMSRNVHPF